VANVCPVPVEGNAAILLAAPIVERACPVFVVRCPELPADWTIGAGSSRTVTLLPAQPPAPEILPAMEFPPSAPDLTIRIQSPADEPTTLSSSSLPGVAPPTTAGAGVRPRLT
jgi:hypothetical protein